MAQGFIREYEATNRICDGTRPMPIKHNTRLFFSLEPFIFVKIPIGRYCLGIAKIYFYGLPTKGYL